MTNGLAAVLVLLIGGAIAADVMFNDGVAVLFLARKFTDLLEWMAFWR